MSHKCSRRCAFDHDIESSPRPPFGPCEPQACEALESPLLVGSNAVFRATSEGLLDALLLTSMMTSVLSDVRSDQLTGLARQLRVMSLIPRFFK